MPRLPRFKLANAEAWYHIWNAAACRKGDFPLDASFVRHHFLSLLQFYARIYFCRVASYDVLGNHFHLVLRFDEPRTLSQEELRERAEALYPDHLKQLDIWPKSKWKRLEERLFDISEFMRNLEGSFATWYNRIRNRKGHFWGQRFKSNVLGGPQAVLDCTLYVELNGVRANLAECPEDYKGCSLYVREAGCDGWLMPLSEILQDAEASRRELHARFKELCYYRGAVITKAGQKPISEETIRREKAQGFAQRGVFRRRMRCFTDGVFLGAEAKVLEYLAGLREKGWYKRRRNAVAQYGELFTLREQRSNFVPL